MLDEFWTVTLTQLSTNDSKVRVEAGVEVVIVGDWVA